MHYSNLMPNRIPRPVMIKLIDLAVNLSPRNLVRILDLLRPLSRNTWQEQGFIKIKELVLEGHGCVRAAQRFSRQLSAETKKRVFENFVIKGMLEGFDKRFSFYESHGFGPPPVLAISPTSRCNLNCFGCYSAGHDQTDELSFDEIDNIIEQAKAVGTNIIMLTGGEPFMRKDLVLRLIKKHWDAAFQIYTNSLLIQKEDIPEIVRAGNTSLAISVEGLEEETDRRRGKGTFARIGETMGQLTRAGGIAAFSATATRENLDSILSDEFIQTMIDMGFLYGWYLQYIPVGTRAAIDLMPTPAQRVSLTKRVREMRRDYPILLGMFWNDGNILEGCMAPKKYIHINSKGDVEPCVFAHFSTHNIREHSYEDILEAPFFHRLRENHPFNADHRRPCPVIDNPRILRRIMEEIQPVPTEQDADRVLGELAPFLDNYAEEYARLLEEEKD